MQRKSAGIHENIRFLGVREDISTMLHSMDVFVFPSLYEGLGLVLLEAQASGIPCIVSEAIQPEADLNIGLISRLSLNDRPEIWAEKIIEVAKKKERNKNKIIDHFERNGYSIPLAITKLMEVYKINGGGANEESINRFL